MPMLNNPLAQNSPQNFGFQTWPTLFLNDVKQRIVDNVAGLEKSDVFWSEYDDAFHFEFPTADKFITLFIPDMPVGPADAGGGPYDTPIDSVLQVKVFVKLENNPEGRSHSILIDQSLGKLAFLQQIITALHKWNGPVDSGSVLSHFAKPMWFLGAVNVPKQSKGGRWSLSTMRFMMPFVADLRYPYPNSPIT